MSAPATPPNPTLFFETINAYQRTAALKAAVDLGVFNAFGGVPATAGELADRCQCPVRGIRILCDSLTLFGFLTKDDSRYAPTSDTAFFLDKNSPAYLGNAIKFLTAPGIKDAFDGLTSTIKNGKVHASEEGTTAPDHPVWIDFARTMGPMMFGPAQGAAALVELDTSRDTKVLDISASHGTFGIALAQKSPRSHLVALDWEAVLAVTEENAKAAGLGDRFSKIVGNAFTVDLGSNYDVVLVPNFLHHFNIADCTGFLKKVKAALRPGGKVVIVEFVPNDDRISPPSSASFSLVMLGTTPEGDAYTFAEYQKMLGEAGFKDAALHPLAPTAQSAVIGVA
ncbi:ubiquinone/menaquinone biosynthesis C-methylase UbiE [Roseimicrobium gellanilyticum]|uniref:Ubiquinone/menaquinone biosynthesis C-methylase UbiE n=1 Tax=Roseimicrobium gellanilyticum TaxID=748857 RepID=A0A366HSK7_9BACT|nr:class I SAM-dependent methyltransferase [Roseimicrobium gellanilyticum]RBP45893.1 ubiquinone/menaquinone biosynthesis C-methylase UbiE [Roseimicrobium gellanilyticum]